jgi:ketosteroid isomerase-like protein
MSDENVEIVRRAYEAWNRGDGDAAIELLDPDVKWSLPPHFPDAETWHGRDRVVDGLREMMASWESLQMDVRELIDDGDRVVARVRFEGRSALTGIDLAGRGVDTQIWTLRDGLAVEVRMFGGAEDPES